MGFVGGKAMKMIDLNPTFPNVYPVPSICV